MPRCCSIHPSKPAALRVLWADGRAVWFPCSRACLAAWKKRQGRWAAVVSVKPLGRAK